MKQTRLGIQGSGGETDYHQAPQNPYGPPNIVASNPIGYFCLVSNPGKNKCLVPFPQP